MQLHLFCNSLARNSTTTMTMMIIKHALETYLVTLCRCPRLRNPAWLFSGNQLFPTALFHTTQQTISSQHTRQFHRHSRHLISFFSGSFPLIGPIKLTMTLQYNKTNFQRTLKTKAYMYTSTDYRRQLILLKSTSRNRIFFFLNTKSEKIVRPSYIRYYQFTLGLKLY